jgi:crotonobetainyl-CoA:carnitine CoA-transferase CaiB-like acyl-CoA transferase
MLDSITTLQMQELSVYTVGHVPQQRSAEPHAHVYIRAPYGTFKTLDGFIALAMPALDELGRIIGEESFLTMSSEVHGWTHRDELYTKTAAKLELQPSAHWLDAFSKSNIWAGPVYGYEELVNDPQIAHNGTFVEYDHPTEGHVKTPGFPYKFSKTPAQIYRGAPLTGEHTREILADTGISVDRVEALLESGAVGAPVADGGTADADDVALLDTAASDGAASLSTGTPASESAR